MNRVLSIAWLMGLGALGCSGTGNGSDGAAGSQHLRLEQACSANSDCPASFECEAETEHGVSSTFCSSIDPISPNGSGGAMCPSGYEVELEHGVSFCKAHAGGGGDAAHDDGDDQGAGGSDDHGAGGSDDGGAHDAGDDHGAGGSDDGAAHDMGDDHGAGGSDDGGAHDAGDDHGAGGSDDSGKGKDGK